MGTTDVDIRRFAKVFGLRLDNQVIPDCLVSWDSSPKIVDDGDGFPVGNIPVYDRGFDTILAFDEKWGKPHGDGTSPIWVSYVRFFSPDYCRGKAITPYSAPMLDDVKLPLTRQEVRKRFGQPTKIRRDAVHCDEYFYEDCIVRFCYPNQKDHVAFVELARHSAAPGEQSRIQ